MARTTLTSRSSRTPRGVTLLELLIVMTIMLMVTAAAIPIMRPAMQNRRMREATRLASSYFAGARARAIETGRPVGVMIERFNGQPYAMQLSYVEVPPPYAGDFLNSRIKIDSSGQIMGFVQNDFLWQNQIRWGDLIKLDYRGQSYRLSSVNTTTDPEAGKVIPKDPTQTSWFLMRTDGTVAAGLPAAYNTVGVPFQIFRQPIRSSAPPQALPEGVVIDLICSGVTTTGTFPPSFVDPLQWSTNPPVPWNPVVIFSPNGSVRSYTTDVILPPTGPMFLLLGRRDLMADVATGNVNANLHDAVNNQHLQNFWLTIQPQNGLVSVNENAPTTSDTDYAGGRRFAAQGQTIGGQ